MESVKPFFEMVGYYLDANCSSAYYYGSIAAHYQLGAAGNGLCGLGDGGHQKAIKRCMVLSTMNMTGRRLKKLWHGVSVILIGLRFTYRNDEGGGILYV